MEFDQRNGRRQLNLRPSTNAAALSKRYLLNFILLCLDLSANGFAIRSFNLFLNPNLSFFSVKKRYRISARRNAWMKWRQRPRLPSTRPGIVLRRRWPQFGAVWIAACRRATCSRFLLKFVCPYLYFTIVLSNSRIEQFFCCFVSYS